MLLMMSAVKTGKMSAVETRHLLYSLLIYTLSSARQHGLVLKPGAPHHGSPDLLHRRSDSEHEAMLGVYVGPGWLIFGHLGSLVGSLGELLGRLGDG